MSKRFAVVDVGQRKNDRDIESSGPPWEPRSAEITCSISSLFAMLTPRSRDRIVVPGANRYSKGHKSCLFTCLANGSVCCSRSAYSLSGGAGFAKWGLLTGGRGDCLPRGGEMDLRV